MADYIYLLENRLSATQRAALTSIRGVAAENGLTIFLIGGAVRDLTSGSPVRDLDFLVQGNALTLRPQLETVGIEVTGVQDDLRTLYLSLPGAVRAELGSALSASYPKPGKPVFQPSSLGEDLRRRDFTANAMALSLNEGSYGLLIDPLNGVADIENRQLRLVSNYGFIEEPVRLVRAARFMARLGWTLEEKTQARYDTAREEDYISTLNDFHRGYELEEILHEEDPLRVLKRLEAEGWMKNLAPFWVSSRISAPDLERLREAQMQLNEQGITANGAAAVFPLLTAKFSDKEMTSLKASLPRRGFVEEVEGLEAETKEFVARLVSKAASTPSSSWKTITSARSEAVLQAAFSSKSPAVQAKFHSFFSEWPQARQRIPYALMQEMRISPEMDGYADLVETLFFALMDGQLTTPEELRAFLEPYSPPAPAPPANLKRTKAAKKEGKPARSRGKKIRTEEIEDQDTADSDDEVSAEKAASIDIEEDEPVRDAGRAHEQGDGEEDEVEDGSPENDEKDEATEPVLPRDTSPMVPPLAPAVSSSGPAKRSRPAKGTSTAALSTPLEKPVNESEPVTIKQVSKQKPLKPGVAPSKETVPAAARSKGKSAVVEAPKKMAAKEPGKKVAGRSVPLKGAKQSGKPVRVEPSAGAGNKAAAAKKPPAPPKKTAVRVAKKAATKTKAR